MESVWSEDLEDKLIDLWQQYECLYQITAGSYRDRQKKRNVIHIAESVGSRRELVANSCTHRRCRHDKTVLSRQRRWCVLGFTLKAHLTTANIPRKIRLNQYIVSYNAATERGYIR